MSGVHDGIADQALRALPPRARAVYEPFRDEFLRTCWYPDVFADRTMSAAAKAAIDPEADRFIYPDPPRSARYNRILKLTQQEEDQGVSPLRQLYLAEHYLEAAVASLRAGDARAAAMFCGVFSHTIGDVGEPIHALRPQIVDLVVPPPALLPLPQRHLCSLGSWKPLPRSMAPQASSLQPPAPPSRRPVLVSRFKRPTRSI